MGIFGKIKSGITYPFRKTGGAVASAGGKMKRWFWSKTIGAAVLSLAAASIAALFGDPEFQELVKGAAPWALPVLMIILRLVTKGPVSK